MRILYILKKCILEILRDWKMLVFSLIFGPMFVLIFYAFYNNTQIIYKIIVNNADKQVLTKENVRVNAGDELIKLLKNRKNSDGSAAFNITLEKDKNKALTELKNKKYDVYIEVPQDFSESIQNRVLNSSAAKIKLNIYGDMGSSRYIVPAITIGTISEQFVSSVTGIPKTLDFVEKSIVTYKNRTEFEAAIPSAIFLGIVMLIFTSAIALIKEVETGTIRRLQISKASSAEMLAAVTISQLFIGIAAIFLTAFTAFVVFHAKSEGSIVLVYFITILACISIIAIGFILAGFSRSTSDILILGNLPYFLLFLLSGAFPVPRINIVSFSNHSIAVNDIFPTTPAMTALKLVMDHGKGLNDVMFEIIMIVVLTIIYFVVGIYLFSRKHMKLD